MSWIQGRWPHPFRSSPPEARFGRRRRNASESGVAGDAPECVWGDPRVSDADISLGGACCSGHEESQSENLQVLSEKDPRKSPGVLQ